MNQNILFSDLHFIDNQNQCIQFDATQSGMLIPCFVTFDWLKKRILVEVDTEEEMLAVFLELKFELEELVEEEIEVENFNAQGEIWIK